MTPTVELVLATDLDGLLAVRSYGEWSLPWPLLPQDMKHLRTLLTRSKQVVVCGRGTWRALSPKLRTLIEPQVRVLSRSNDPTYYHSLAHALEGVTAPILIIGGAQVYAEALTLPGSKLIHWTEVQTRYPRYSDLQELAVWPLTARKAELLARGSLTLETTTTYQLPVYQLDYHISTYRLENSLKLTAPIMVIPSNLTPTQSEDPWLDLVKRILIDGHDVPGRNGLTRSLFGVQLRYDLSQGFPLNTSKRSYPKAIFLETQWMFRGCTNTQWLADRGVSIWNANASAATLNALGLPWVEGDIGPGYGFQLRHYGATYQGMEHDYTGQGVDQLARVVEQLRTQPNSRRIVIDLWNPQVVDQCALPPCHVLYQFQVRDGHLDCHLFQRSWDVFLGWNTTTAALWVHLLAAATGLIPGTLVHSISDAHLYHQHLAAARQLVSRQARPLPQLRVTTVKEPWAYEWTDLRLDDYYPLPALTAEMKV